MEREMFFSEVKRSLQRSDSPDLNITFEFFFFHEYYNLRVSPLPTPLLYFDNMDCTTVYTTVQGSLSRATVEDALGAPLAQSLRGRECERAIQLAWRMVPGFLMREENRKHVELTISMRIRFKYLDDAPAAPSSLWRLDDWDVDEEDGGFCRICLEEAYEGLRMPCLDVFHADCIVEWLRMSHYCPVCQFQMPTPMD
ncbi:uncharacterized protein LOC125206850 [Salvia hispanica]|uniref:uncharacterized protein LOC125206850 n=1 Tax=Salvia hispanica TaxID=49212 RepID=UPI002009973D|nr:uncharacterized protein LOC125206850 [Salvia hispanica]